MKNAVIIFAALAGFAFAQDKPPEGVKRLDSVTWDLNTHKLAWVVQNGTVVNGEFVVKSSARYEVSPDEASMKSADEKRGVTAEEADSLHHLLDVLSLYCAESTAWWDKGQGSPVKVDLRQQPARKPQYRISKTDAVAEAH